MRYLEPSSARMRASAISTVFLMRSDLKAADAQIKWGLMFKGANPIYTKIPALLRLVKW